jgi:hypothetical protein
MRSLMPCCYTTNGQNRDTIKITRETNVGLPHHKGLMPAYPMKKKTQFIYHIIKAVRMRLYS